MFKSEPKTILQFLATHFDLLKQLFEFQVKNDAISRSQISETLREFNSDIESQLFEHKLLVKQNDYYIINEPYFILFEFVLQKFKPLLPEEIEKFGQSIKNLFLLIKDGVYGDKNILLERIDALSKEIKKFTNAIVNNTQSLLNESKQLKANIQKVEYQEKIQKARHLIDHYIIPLNNILDITHSQSIYNELLNISSFSNSRRFDYADESIRRQFEKLYGLLKQVEKDISQQSVVLSNELLPLIDRIKTESEYLQGFYLYLKNADCYKKFQPPKLLATTRGNIYNPFIYESTKEFFNQFQNEETVFIKENKNAIEQQWIFDKNKYKSQLDSQLPIDDFFSWCEKSLINEKKNFSFEDYFMVTTLIFEKDYAVYPYKKHQNISLKTGQGELIMPKLKINKRNGIPK